MSSAVSKPMLVRPGVYARGAETVDLILKAALEVLIDEGAGAFTLRRIAAKCGMKVGNLSYHFPRKEALVQLLLEEMLASYEQILDSTVRLPDLSPEERLEMVITICLDDITSKRTTRLFTELWALANHNAVIADRVESFYRTVHAIIAVFVKELNPALSPEDAELVALYISASMEGTTPFLGYAKPWRGDMDRLKTLSIAALVHLAKTVTPGDIRGTEEPVSLKTGTAGGRTARRS